MTAIGIPFVPHHTPPYIVRFIPTALALYSCNRRDIPHVQSQPLILAHPFRLSHMRLIVSFLICYTGCIWLTNVATSS